MMAKKQQFSEEELKQKFMVFRMLQQKIEEINQHLELLHQHNTELEESKNALREFAASEAGSDVLAPIAGGVFVKTTLKEVKTLLVNVGGNTVVEKTVSEVIALLEQQEKDMIKNVVEAQQLSEQLQQQARHIYKEVEDYVQ